MKNVQKSLIALSLTLAVMLSLTACGKKADDSADVSINNEIPTKTSETISEIPNDETLSQTDDIQWDYAYDFSEGLAWVVFKTGKIENEVNTYESYYFGVIDKTGKMVFRIKHAPTDPVSVTKYSNGFAYVIHNDKIDVIDTSGVTVSSYPINDNTCVRAYGDGYTLTEEHHADFDSNAYKYTMYSPKGEALKTIETEAWSNFVRYLGQGVFLCNANMYFLKSGAELSVDAGRDYHEMFFYEDTAAMGVEYYDSDKDGDSGKLKLIGSDGEKSELEVPSEYGRNWNDYPVIKHGLCIVSSAPWTIYDFSKKEFTVIPENYAEKQVWVPSCFDNSKKIELTMQGSDGNHYVALFDSTWNMITDPIQIRRGYGYSDAGFVFSDDRLIVSNIGISEDPTTCVYDGNGNLVYELYEKGFYGISPYSDDVACVSKWDGRYRGTGYSVHLDGDGRMELDDNEIPQYLDLNGNLLFETIDMSKTIDR